MKVLFVGNSHTYFNDMPEMFAQFVERTVGEKPDVTMLAYSGRELEWHRSEYFSIRFALMYGGFDYCVIQQAAHPYPPVDQTEKYFGQLADICRRCGTKPVVFMTWAQKEHPENQQIMIDTCEKLARDNGALLAPIGAVWERVINDYPDIDLFYEDGGHAGVYGDFLIASVLCRTMTGDISPNVSGEGFDFNCGAPVEWEPPTVCEDKERIPVKLDKNKTDSIIKTINNFFTNRGDM